MQIPVKLIRHDLAPASPPQRNSAPSSVAVSLVSISHGTTFGVTFVLLLAATSASLAQHAKLTSTPAAATRSAALTTTSSGCTAQDAETQALDKNAIIEKAIAAAGGKEHLLTMFQMKERYSSGPVAALPEKSSPRESVLEPPKYWWVNGKDREGEPAKFVLWGWTLTILNDAKASIEKIAGVEENGRTTVALRIRGVVDPEMDLHFDRDTFRLVRIDWRDDIYRFSDWRVHNGTGYHARTAIYKKSSKEPWFHHEVVAVERLAKLPDGLSR